MLTYNPHLQVFQSTLFPKVTHGFGTRMSGNGRDKKAVERYLHSYSVPFKKLIDPNQQHTDNILVVNDSTHGVESTPCDGLITDKQGVALTVITADCAPIIYTDIKKNIVGISHNGRKGTELKLVQKMINKFCALGSTLHNLRVALGPSIGACCYQMNLVKENVEQLLAMGITKDHLDFFPFCTKCDSKRFFSYRNMRDVPNFPEQFSFISC